VRAVSSPYPGAFSDFPAGRLLLWRTRVIDDEAIDADSGKLLERDGRIEIHPAGGGLLHVLDGEFSGVPLSALDAVRLRDLLNLPASSPTASKP
jgi:methionyl-tRNA formyltransferase